jgi:hypothetical protein
MDVTLMTDIMRNLMDLFRAPVDPLAVAAIG